MATITLILTAISVATGCGVLVYGRRGTLAAERTEHEAHHSDEDEMPGRRE
jgi:hypothetical protein